MCVYKKVHLDQKILRKFHNYAKTYGIFVDIKKILARFPELMAFRQLFLLSITHLHVSLHVFLSPPWAASRCGICPPSTLEKLPLIVGVFVSLLVKQLVALRR